MKNVKVFGTGCWCCQVTGHAGTAGIGIAQAPGRVVDGRMMHAGGRLRAGNVAQVIAA